MWRARGLIVFHTSHRRRPHVPVPDMDGREERTTALGVLVGRHSMLRVRIAGPKWEEGSRKGCSSRAGGGVRVVRIKQRVPVYPTPDPSRIWPSHCSAAAAHACPSAASQLLYGDKHIADFAAGMAF